MTSREVSTPGVNSSDAVTLANVMSHHGDDAARDIGRLYMTLHKISIINQAREAKCSNS